MPVHSQIAIYLAVAVGAVAAATDVAWRRVPNWLTLPAAVAGLLIAGYHGLPALAMSVAGLALGLAAGVAGMLLGATFGGGDAKLLAAFGALGGPAFVASALLYGALAGGLLAVAAALGRRQLMQAVNGLVTFIGVCASRGRPISLEKVSHSGVTVPFAVALAAGAAAAAFLPPLWALAASAA